MKISKKHLIILSSLLMAFSCSFSADASTVSFERISGQSRYETSVSVSRKCFTSSDNAIVVSGDSFPDALSSGQLATQLSCPILLTNSRSLNNSVRSELHRLGVKKVTIVGGNSSVSPNTEREISKIAYTERLAGNNRYSTSTIVANRTLHLNPSINKCAVVSGRNFADALSASTFVSANKSIMILNDGNNMIPSGNFEVTLIGGNVAVPSNAGRVNRLYGSNRYDTSLKVANSIYPTPENVVFASGSKYPDALAAISVLNTQKAPLILSNNVTSSKINNYLSSSNVINNIFVIGGHNSVSEYTITNTVNLINKDLKAKEDREKANKEKIENKVDTSSNSENIRTEDKTASSSTSNNSSSSASNNSGNSDNISGNNSSSNETSVEKSFFESNYNYVDRYSDIDKSSLQYTDESLFKIDENGIITGFKKNTIETLVIPDYINGIKVKRIGNYVFKNKGIRNLVLPAYLESIGGESFKNNLIEKVLFPDTMLYINDSAFLSNEIKEVYIPQYVIEIGSRAFKQNHISSLVINKDSRLTYLSYGSFKSNNLSSVTVPKSCSCGSAFDEGVVVDVRN